MDNRYAFKRYKRHIYHLHDIRHYGYIEVKQERETKLIDIMESFKSGIDYEGRILRDQAIRDGCYEPGFNDSTKPQGSIENYDPEPKTFKKMIIESKYYLMGALQNSNNQLIKLS